MPLRVSWFCAAVVWADLVVAPLHGATPMDFIGFAIFLGVIALAIAGISLLVLRGDNWVPGVQAFFGFAIVVLGLGDYEPATLGTWLLGAGLLLLIASAAGYLARHVWIRRLVAAAGSATPTRA